MTERRFSLVHYRVPFLWFGLLAVLLLLAWQPMLRGLVPWRGDGLLHFVRLAQLERAVQGGDLFPRWSPDLGYGFGFPLFNFYAPFGYYVSLIPRLLGLPLTVSLQMSYGLALLVLAAGMFLWARAVWGSDWAGVTAVLAAIYSPYMLYNTYHRAALAELWGLAWLVMALWAIAEWGVRSAEWGVGQKKTIRYGLLVALFLALLLLSHNITALIGFPGLIIYALLLQFHAPQAPRPTLFFALLLGLALSAFFWLPAFLEKSYVQIENLTATANFAYTSHFLSWRELFAWPQTADPTQVNPAIPRSLSWPVIFLALLAWLPVQKTAVNSPISNRQSPKYHRLALTLVTVACLFMTLPASQPIWDAVPLLAFVQFPWRFLGPAAISLAMLAALGLQNIYAILAARYPSAIVGYGLSVICLTLPLFALPWLFPGSSPPLPASLTPLDTIRFEIETGWLGTTAAADYLPRTVQQLPPSDSLIPRYEAAPPDGFISRLDAAQLPAGFVIQDQLEQFTRTRLQYHSAEEVTAVFDLFAFPGWQAQLDGRSLPTSLTQPEGLITAVLPPGDHTFQLAFANTPLRAAANTLSLVSLLLLAALAVFSAYRPSSRAAHQAKPTASPSGAVFSLFTGVCLMLVALFLLKTVYLDHANTPFRRVAFDGQTLTGVSTPAQVNFGDEIMLLGYDLPTRPIPADQPIDLTLYWRALPPVAAEYSVSVQLFSENGRRYAQSDSFHPAGFPLPRWQPGEYGRDAHTLAILLAAPPGVYQLLALVYDPATGRRLNVLNEAGLPLDNKFTLGTVAVAPPLRFPDPADLPIGARETEGGGRSPVLGENVQLLGYDQPLRDPTVGDVLPITLYWYTPHVPALDYTAELWLACENGGVVTRLPADARFAPNTTWQPGQLQRADYDVPIAPLAENGRPLLAGFCTTYLRLFTPDTSTSIALETLPVSAPERVFDLPAAAQPIGESLADLVTLAAYELDTAVLQPGQSFNLTLYWQPEQVLAAGFTTFVQLIGPDGRPITQRDQIPANGSRPTSGWVPGELIRDDFTLTLPSDTPPGAYHLITGLYDSLTGARLPLATRNGDAVTLPQTIEVKQR